MRSTTKNIYLYGLLGLVAVGAFTAFSLLLWQNKAETNSGISLAGIFETLFFIATAFLVYRKYHRIEFYNIEAFLSSLVLSGLLVLLISLLPELISRLGYSLSKQNPAIFIYDRFSKLLIFVFYLFCAMMFYRLASTKNQKQQGYYLLGTVIVISAGMFLQIFPGLQHNNSLKAFYILSGSLVFLLIIRLDWIALLSVKAKVLATFTLAIFCLVLFGLTRGLLGQAELSHTNWTLEADLPLLVLVFFADAYALASFLSLLFNLPIASFIEKKNAEIESFMRLNRSIVSNAETPHILKTLFKTLMQNTNADSGWVMLCAEGQDDIIIEAEQINEKDIARLQSSLTDKQRLQLTPDNRYLYIKDIRKDPNLRNHDVDARSLIEFPIRVKDEIRGRMFLLKRIVAGFDEYRINLAESFIAQAIVSLQNNDLLHDALKAERLKEDLEIGKNVQKRLLPESFPYNNRIDMAADSEAARQVGGDYYDFYRIDENKMGLLMGDVSGKGTAAAFHVAKMKGIFQSLMLESYSPARFIEKANTAVSLSFDKGMFITLTYLEVDLSKHMINYSRGGHCPLLVYKAINRSAEYLEDEGLGLGILRNGSFAKTICEKSLSYRKGDAFCLYTDGLVEARHAINGEEFGYERLQQYLQDYGKLEAKEIVKRLMNRVSEFSGSDNQLDDISILVFKPA